MIIFDVKMFRSNVSFLLWVATLIRCCGYLSEHLFDLYFVFPPFACCTPPRGCWRDLWSFLSQPTGVADVHSWSHTNAPRSKSTNKYTLSCSMMLKRNQLLHPREENKCRFQHTQGVFHLVPTHINFNYFFISIH